MKNELLERAESKIIEYLGNGLIEDLSPHHLSEPRGNYFNYASRVVRPRSTKEASTIMSILNQTKTKVIPFCGGTGLVGGQMAPQSDYILLI